ncbi:MAG: ABC transporter permease [Candidatus Woesearchaeota archaeon]
MKLIKILQKNFKILFRKKTSLFTIILGPLFVIMLLGLAFSSNTNIQISLGYISPDSSPLTTEFVETLNKDYLVTQLFSKESCIEELEQGLLHGCIIFPEEFSIENNKTNNLIFIVDKSRMSLVYSIIEEISSDIDIKTDEVSKDLTNKILDTLFATSENLNEVVALIVKNKAMIDEEVDNSKKIETELSKISLDSSDLGLSDLDKDVTKLHTYTKSVYEDVESNTEECLEYIANIRSAGVSSNVSSMLSDIEDNLESLNSSSYDDFNTSYAKLQIVLSLVDLIDEKVSEVEDITSAQKNSLTGLKTSLEKIYDDLEKIKISVENTQKGIKNIEVTSTENIVNPIKTTVETISTTDNKLILLFPYMLILIIMFSSLILASTLIVVEKQSNATFRTFTTPTKGEYFIITNFITTFLIVIAQIVVVLGVTSYFIPNFILENIYVNLVLISLAISLFTMIGMIIGYILKTQQATNMATIFVGTIFLFISNIMFPLETISPLLKNIASFNPFVITSELLRKSIIFKISFDVIIKELGILLLYCVVFLILMIVFQKISQSLYFNRIALLRGKNNKFTSEFILILEEKIVDKEHLIKKLEAISEEEYKLFLKDNFKEFKKFLTVNLNLKIGNSKKLQKDKLIKLLQKSIEKQSKNDNSKLKSILDENKNDVYKDEKEEPSKKYRDLKEDFEAPKNNQNND